MTTAYEIGRTLGQASDHVSKKERKALLSDAGLEVTSVTVEQFEAGRQAGIAERKEAEAPAKAAREAELAAIRERNERRCDAVAAAEKSHRGEELHSYAARKQRENIGLDGEVPASVLAAHE